MTLSPVPAGLAVVLQSEPRWYVQPVMTHHDRSLATWTLFPNRCGATVSMVDDVKSRKEQNVWMHGSGTDTTVGLSRAGKVGNGNASYVPCLIFPALGAGRSIHLLHPRQSAIKLGRPPLHQECIPTAHHLVFRCTVYHPPPLSPLNRCVPFHPSSSSAHHSACEVNLQWPSRRHRPGLSASGSL